MLNDIEDKPKTKISFDKALELLPVYKEKIKKCDDLKYRIHNSTYKYNLYK